MTDMREDVTRRLEDAGRTIMMLPMPADGLPAGLHVVWPDFEQRFWDLAGVAEEGSVLERLEDLAQDRNATTLHASREAITRLDEVLGWLMFVQVARERRVVFARMLVHPLGDRPVYSWSKIAQKMGANSRSVRRWHLHGIDAILLGLASE